MDPYNTLDARKRAQDTVDCPWSTERTKHDRRLPRDNWKAEYSGSPGFGYGAPSVIDIRSAGQAVPAQGRTDRDGAVTQRTRRADGERS